MKPKRPKVEPIRGPTLFEMEKLEEAPKLADEPRVERCFSLPGIFLGTSSFTASGWEGSFYPRRMQPADYLSYYASQFPTVEVDSTFYGIPSILTVNSWFEKTPPDFTFSVKVPKLITHEKVLVNCDVEWKSFLDTIEILGEKLGPLLLQFGYFSENAFKSADEFLARLRPFLKKLPKGHRFAVEIRNTNWLDAKFADVLREYNVALALTDTSFVPRPWEIKEKFDMITADFAYVRWLGERKEIEAQTKSWDKTVIDRREDLTNWVELFRQVVARNLKIFGYANNHYAGHGPATVKLFMDLWGGRK